MSGKTLSLSEVLARLVERVRQIESDASTVGNVLEKMLARTREREARKAAEPK